jgi:glutaredoxin
MDITVYGREGCTYCDKAKDYLRKMNLPFNYVDINEDFDAAMELKEKFGAFKTVPQIVIDNELIGGYSELTWMIVD